MAAGGGAYFPYISIYKTSFQKPMDRFQYNLAEKFLWWPSTKIVQAVMIVKKHGRQGAGLIFPI